MCAIATDRRPALSLWWTSEAASMAKIGYRRGLRRSQHAIPSRPLRRSRHEGVCSWASIISTSSPIHMTPARAALRAMGVLGVAGLVSRLGVSSGEAKSKKKGGKRKNRAKTSPACPTCPTSPAPATCPGTCNSGCAQCFLRLGASALCGQSATPNCGMGCSSDSDCVGSDRPYCVTHDYRRTDAQTSNVCPSPGGWCTAVVDCIF
jgi:hypothetical protein